MRHKYHLYNSSYYKNLSAYKKLKLRWKRFKIKISINLDSIIGRIKYGKDYCTGTPEEE